jgi:hypothetical protein
MDSEGTKAYPELNKTTYYLPNPTYSYQTQTSEDQTNNA